MMRLTWCTVVGCLLGLIASTLAVAAEPFRLPVRIQGGEKPQKNVLVKVLVDLEIGALAQAKEAKVRRAGSDAVWTAQITAPSLLAKATATPDQKLPREIHILLPEVAANAQLDLEVTIDPAVPATTPTFHWEDTAGKHADLMFGDRPVLRYMYEGLDASTKDRRAETMKVYHHLFDPTGKRLVTKGPGGLFPHHRGIYFGFNKISYGKQSADTWHCNNGESQQHQSFEAAETGPLLGRHRLRIGWHGKDGQVFATETRELTAYNVPGGTLVEFASRLESNVGEIKLAGDPQHAGVQFRATQEVPDKTAKLTYYVRPDGVGKPGQFRNWPGDKGHANLPWLALSFVVGEDRYTCCYLDRPENPKESRFSERDYGRFGSYFETSIDTDRPLEVNYRYWFQAGEMDVEQVQAESEKFTQPPVATVGK